MNSDSFSYLILVSNKLTDVTGLENLTKLKELHLSRKLQERRIFPALDIDRSSTRREELLLGPDITQRVWLMRRMYNQMVASPPNGAGMDMAAATEAVNQQIRQTENNFEFLEQLGKTAE